MKLHSYPKVYALGHAAIKELFFDPVSVEEKIDGSQFSFGLVDGNLKCRSHHQEIDIDCPPQMFAGVVGTVIDLMPDLQEGWVYRGECLNKPHHNTLCYDRTPKNNIIIFDIDVGIEDYLIPRIRRITAEALGFESVPIFYEGQIENYEEMKKFLDEKSCLGGTQVEGLVFKNPHRFARDGHALMGKYVREDFKEVNQANWRQQGGKYIIQQIGESYKTTARWNKAIQHLKDKGELLNEPKDIGALLKEINKDVFEECAEEISQKLFKWAWKDISRIITRGFPEWYKEELAKKQFKEV